MAATIGGRKRSPIRRPCCPSRGAVPPLAPHFSHRAEWRSRSLDASGPQRMISGVNAWLVWFCVHRSPKADLRAGLNPPGRSQGRWRWVRATQMPVGDSIRHSQRMTRVGLVKCAATTRASRHGEGEGSTCDAPRLFSEPRFRSPRRSPLLDPRIRCPGEPLRHRTFPVEGRFASCHPRSMRTEIGRLDPFTCAILM
jgi:hypothetical protein